MTETGSDRYAELELVNLPTTTAGGAPGSVDYSPFGAAVRVGEWPQQPVGNALASSSPYQAGNPGLQPAQPVDGAALAGADKQAQFASLAQEGYEKACFSAGTPLETPDGSRAIEQLREGDLVLSRSEFDPAGPVEAKRVEEVFVRTGRVWVLKAQNREIRTTAEHPVFLVRLWKFVPVCEL